MHILAHRALGFGEPENSRKACLKAVESGLGVEIDVRLGRAGRIVLSHDAPKSDSWDLEEAVPVLSKISGPVAVHLKDQEPLVWHRVCACLAKIPQAFLFDLSLSVARSIRAAFPSLPLSFSVADCNTWSTLYRLDDVIGLPECDIVWWDEWQRLGSLYHADGIQRIRSAGKKVYAISPELHAMGSPRHEQSGQPELSWHQLKALGVDGICTDFPGRAARFFASS
jgi:glycerophosphoryl diester phosphodiesterase